MSRVIKLDFVKTDTSIDTASYSHVDLTNPENLAAINKYVLPVIAKNRGWDAENLTAEEFNKDPLQFQDVMDASLFANVHILLDDSENPVALLEYLEETIENPISKIRMNNLIDLIENKEAWKYLLDRGVLNEEALDSLFDELKSFFANKKIYSEIGIVIKSELQGKSSGYTQMLYEILNDGILFGWTSNPLIVVQWRKYFKSVTYFPLLNESITDIEALASLAILYADLLTYKTSRWKDLEFGSLTSQYFISKRGTEYLELVDDLKHAGKISDLDVERLLYFIRQESVQGAIFATN